MISSDDKEIDDLEPEGTDIDGSIVYEDEALEPRRPNWTRYVAHFLIAAISAPLPALEFFLLVNIVRNGFRSKTWDVVLLATVLWLAEVAVIAYVFIEIISGSYHSYHIGHFYIARAITYVVACPIFYYLERKSSQPRSA